MGHVEDTLRDTNTQKDTHQAQRLYTETVNSLPLGQLYLLVHLCLCGTKLSCSLFYIQHLVTSNRPMG